MGSRIAVVGWGSLIWDRRGLPVLYDRWFSDGPFLPVEFARISQRGRLTLVVEEDVPCVPSLWNVSPRDDWRIARQDLADREGVTNFEWIGVLDLVTGDWYTRLSAPLQERIYTWAEEKDLSAVIWSDLPANFSEELRKRQCPRHAFTPENVIHYLQRHADKQAAERYIRCTPPQIDTPMRRHIEGELGWTPWPSC